MELAGMSHALYLVVKRLSILTVLVASCLMPVRSATLERLSLDDMISKSTNIVRGSVTASWTAFTGHVVYTHYTVQVSETLKGVTKSSVEIMIPGGTLNGIQQNFSGSPVLNRG